MDPSHQPRAGLRSSPPPPEPAAGGGGGEFTVVVSVILAVVAIASIHEDTCSMIPDIKSVVLVRDVNSKKPRHPEGPNYMTLLVPSSSTLKNSLLVIHQVPEGYVGVYWRGGALQETTTNPGFHLKMPLLTHFEPVQVTLQTDLVRDIPCGTKGGVMINFDRVEVVNRLKKDAVFETLLNYGVQYDHTWIYDKIHHEINQFCSVHSLQEVYIDMFDQIDEKLKDALQADCTRYAPGIEIMSVRITKPKIPESVRRNFEQMEEERTKVLVAMEKQRVAEKEAETKQKIAISEAEKNAHVSKIQMEQKLMEKDSSRRQEEIENTMYLAREKSLADANYYKTMREAEANKLKLTPQFLELKFIDAIANNTKMFFGNKVPNMVLDQRLLGNFLPDVVQ